MTKKKPVMHETTFEHRFEEGDKVWAVYLCHRRRDWYCTLRGTVRGVYFHSTLLHSWSSKAESRVVEYPVEGRDDHWFRSKGVATFRTRREARAEAKRLNKE